MPGVGRLAELEQLEPVDRALAAGHLEHDLGRREIGHRSAAGGEGAELDGDRVAASLDRRAVGAKGRRGDHSDAEKRPRERARKSKSA